MPEPVRSKTTTEHMTAAVCRECRSREIRYRQRSVLDRILGLYPLTCGRCGYPDRRFRFTIGTAVLLLAICGLVGGGVWLRMNPPGFLSRLSPAAGETATPAVSPQDQAEALARARTAAGGKLSTFENMMLNKPKIAMNNATILKLVKAEVSKDVILQMIRTSTADYDLGANDVIELKEAGVDPAIILAMLDASYAAQ